MDGITAIAAILIASFAIDRFVTGLLFLLSLIKPWNRLFPDPALETDPVARSTAEKKRKLIYFSLAAFLAMGVLVGYGNVSILAAVGFSTINPLLDRILTGLILIGGADRVADILKWGTAGGASSPSSTSSSPIEITGKLVLEDASGRKATIGPDGS